MHACERMRDCADKLILFHLWNSSFIAWCYLLSDCRGRDFLILGIKKNYTIKMDTVVYYIWNDFLSMVLVYTSVYPKFILFLLPYFSTDINDIVCDGVRNREEIFETD